MFRSAVLAGAIAATSAVDGDWPAFQEFMVKYGKMYSDDEVASRFAIFKDNLKLIDERNARGGATHGINKFTDMTPQEFKDRYLGRVDFDETKISVKAVNRTFPDAKEGESSVDWCAAGHCTPVKDQGQCGSCWAFGGVENLESDYSINFGELYELSTMQVVACDNYDGGCNGGNAINAWAYVNSVGGIEPASDWQYSLKKSMQTPACIKKNVIPADFKVDTSAYSWISGGAAAQDESNMIAALQTTTLSVAVEADYWQTYTGGVIKAGDGCGTNLDHNVQVTGYNEAGNYYIVRNSWGAGWGEAGFVWVEAGSNVCGIAMETSVPITCTPGSCSGSLSV